MLSPLRPVAVLATDPGLADDGRTVVYNATSGVFDMVDSLTLPVPPEVGGVPDGGTTGQVLAKASNDDHDTGWVTPTSGGTGLSGDANQFYLYSQFWS